MNGLDRMFINVESDRLPMDLIGILLLDPSTAPLGTHSYGRVRGELAARLQGVDIFASRPVAAPFGAGHEHWVADPCFDIDHHIKHVGVPAPYDRSALCELVSSLFDAPLDRSRPLWQAYYVDGFNDGSAAILLRLHHASIDGVGGTELFQQIFDSEPLAPKPATTAARVRDERVPTALELLIRSLPEQIITPARLCERGVPVVIPVARRLVSRFGRTIRLKPDSASTASIRKTNPGPVPRTLFNRPTATTKRAVAMTSIPMADIRRVKDRFGVTLNDVVLAVTHAAVTDYLRDVGDLPEEPLRVASPVNVRDETASAGSGNHFAFMRVAIPTDITEPVERLQTVATLTRKAIPARAKSDTTGTRKPTGSGISGLMKLVDTLPSATWMAVRELVASGAIDSIPPIANYVVSNIPGPKQKLYLAGAEITHIHGRTMIGAGIGVFIFCISYGAELNFGITALAELVPDPATIAEGIAHHFATLDKAS